MKFPNSQLRDHIPDKIRDYIGAKRVVSDNIQNENVVTKGYRSQLKTVNRATRNNSPDLTEKHLTPGSGPAEKIIPRSVFRVLENVLHVLLLFKCQISHKILS